MEPNLRIKSKALVIFMSFPTSHVSCILIFFSFNLKSKLLEALTLRLYAFSTGLCMEVDQSAHNRYCLHHVVVAVV